MIHKHVNAASVVSAQRNVVLRAAASKQNFIPPLLGGILEGRTGFDRVRKIMCARMCG